MDLSIIIVNYNTTEYLRSCLRSIFKHTSQIEYEIIIVDNNSTNRDIEKIATDFSSVQLFLRKRNDGFAAGCNFGTSKAKGKYLAFINPDVEILSNVFKDFVEVLDHNLNIAVIAPVYLDKENNLLFIPKEIPGYSWCIAEAFGNVVNKTISKFRKEKILLENNPFYVDWVMGSFIFIRSEVFEAAGGFDEDYFLYYEDIDLQVRIRKLKYLIQYNPLHRIRHFERSSIRTFKGENTYYFHMTRSFILYMYKHFGFLKRLIIRILHVLGIIIRVVSLPIRPRYSGKKKQKLDQYLVKFKQYVFFRKRQVTNSKYFHLQFMENDKEQIISKDKFWS